MATTGIIDEQILTTIASDAQQDFVNHDRLGRSVEKTSQSIVDKVCRQRTPDTTTTPTLTPGTTRKLI